MHSTWKTSLGLIIISALPSRVLEAQTHAAGAVPAEAVDVRSAAIAKSAAEEMDRLLVRETALDAMNTLRNYPAEVVTPLVVKRVFGSGVAANAVTRRCGFELLCELQGQNVSAAFGILMANVGDPVGAELCV